MVVVFFILDWTFVLMNATTMIPCRRVLWRELSIIESRNIFRQNATLHEVVLFLLPTKQTKLSLTL